jgi:hypothetical protein
MRDQGSDELSRYDSSRLRILFIHVNAICRLMEYQWLPDRLKLNGAICLEPLSSEEVGNYLAKGGSKLAALRDAVNTDPVLQDLAQTPLMLSIMSLACQGVGGDELARRKGDSPEERRKQIFALYVEQMFQRKGMDSLVFPKEKIIGWLAWLARKMREHSQSVFFLVEGLQPSWLGSVAQRGAYGTVVALSLGLSVALMIAGLLIVGSLSVGLIAGLNDWLSFILMITVPTILVSVGLGCWSESPLKNSVMSGSIAFIIFLLAMMLSGMLSGMLTGMLSGELILGLSAISLTFALSVGLIGGLGVGSLNRITVVETLSWKWNLFWKGTIRGSITGLIFGLIHGLNVGNLIMMFGGLILGLIFFGPILGLVSGLVGGWTDTVKVGKAFPNQGIKLSRKNSLAPFFVTWLIVGLSVGLGVALVRLSQGLSVGELIAGLIGGLIAGLIAGLNRGGSAVIKHYALRLILWRCGYTPFKLIKFLDHCDKLILLKKVGGGYIFIHRMLLEYFAELTPQSTKGK